MHDGEREAAKTQADRLFGDGLTIVNRRAEPVKMPVKRSFPGELGKEIDGATIHLLNEDLSSMNRKREIHWEFDLPSGETKKLTYSYIVLIRM